MRSRRSAATARASRGGPRKRRRALSAASGLASGNADGAAAWSASRKGIEPAPSSSRTTRSSNAREPSALASKPSSHMRDAIVAIVPASSFRASPSSNSSAKARRVRSSRAIQRATSAPATTRRSSLSGQRHPPNVQRSPGSRSRLIRSAASSRIAYAASAPKPEPEAAATPSAASKAPSPATAAAAAAAAAASVGGVASRASAEARWTRRASSPDSIAAIVSSAPPTHAPPTNTWGTVRMPETAVAASRTTPSASDASISTNAMPASLSAASARRQWGHAEVFTTATAGFASRPSPRASPTARGTRWCVGLRTR